MANLDFPQGFVPVRYRNSSMDLSCEVGLMNPTHDEIGLYDLVERRTDGYIHRAQASSVTILGVAAEHVAANATGEIKYYPTEGLLMHAQASGNEIDAIDDFDLVYNIVATAPSATTGRSQMEIDSSTGAATATLPIKILRVVPVESQAGNALGANVLLECVLNEGAIKGAGLVG